MKTGSQQRISTLPPKAPDAAERLRKLEAWTEQPARDAVAALEGSEPSEVQQAPENAPVASPEPPTSRGKSGKKSKGEDVKPWDMVEIKDNATIPMNFRIPIPLLKRLRYAGGTIYGLDMTKIVVQALEEKLDKLLEKDGK